MSDDIEDACIACAEQPDTPVCAICLEPACSDVRALSCKHVYHERCIARWVAVAPRCPLCGCATEAAPSAVLSERTVLERMNEAEIQLRAAWRISANNERRLQRWQERAEASRAQPLGRLQQCLDDAEAAAGAASALLREVEAELYQLPPPERVPTRERAATSWGGVGRAASTTLNAASARSWPRARDDSLLRRPLSTRQMGARAASGRATPRALSRPPSANLAAHRSEHQRRRDQMLERQRRAADQMVRAELRVAVQRMPHLTRPSVMARSRGPPAALGGAAASASSTRPRMYVFGAVT